MKLENKCPSLCATIPSEINGPKSLFVIYGFELVLHESKQKTIETIGKFKLNRRAGSCWLHSHYDYHNHNQRMRSG
jgi:hypothetical protein